VVTSLEDQLTVVTATALETRAARRAAPQMRIVEGGIGLSRIHGDQLGDVVVACGVAGGLRGDIPTGTIVVPAEILTPGGETIVCDPELAQALVRAAQRFVTNVERGPLVTSATLVNGPARHSWAGRGYVAADMETGFIKARRIATVRVILDTPARELSAAWLRPATVIVHPHAWQQALWLMREGPRCARLAAKVLAAAFG
jgi:hypothetical protein